MGTPKGLVSSKSMECYGIINSKIRLHFSNYAISSILNYTMRTECVFLLQKDDDKMMKLKSDLLVNLSVSMLHGAVYISCVYYIKENNICLDCVQ